MIFVRPRGSLLPHEFLFLCSKYICKKSCKIKKRKEIKIELNIRAIFIPTFFPIKRTERSTESIRDKKCYANTSGQRSLSLSLKLVLFLVLKLGKKIGKVFLLFFFLFCFLFFLFFFFFFCFFFCCWNRKLLHIFFFLFFYFFNDGSRVTHEPQL